MWTTIFSVTTVRYIYSKIISCTKQNQLTMLRTTKVICLFIFSFSYLYDYNLACQCLRSSDEQMFCKARFGQLLSSILNYNNSSFVKFYIFFQFCMQSLLKSNISFWKTTIKLLTLSSNTQSIRSRFIK